MVVAPYKRPERDLPENERFNNHVSIVRVRSEHAIRFLKGRFQSLKHLCVNICNEDSHIFATYWVKACIGVHAFAMQCASTVATVYRETKNWRWPAVQFAYMTVLAYVISFITYQLLK